MSWITTDRVLAFAAIGALCVSALTMILGTRSGKKLQLAFDKSATAAAESARTARETVVQQARIADSIDALGTRGDQQEAAVARYFDDRRVSWVLRHMTGSTYELANEGTISAYNVRISAEHVARLDPPKVPSEWTAGSSFSVFVVTASMSGVPTIVVEWTPTPLEVNVETWRRSLPPRAS